MNYYARTSNEITLLERQNMEIARKVAGECMVLLENNEILPLLPGKIALFGTGARKTIKGGTGSGDVNSRFAISIEQGLERNGFTVTTKSWLNRYDDKAEKDRKAYLTWMKEEAKRLNTSELGVNFAFPVKGSSPVAISDDDIRESKTDTAIYVISRNSGEGADRKAEKGDYFLYDEEKENLTAICKSYENVIVVLNVGGVMDLTWMKDYPEIDGLLLMTQLGNIGGEVLANVIVGDVIPSGKLSDTWATDYYDYPSSAEFSHNNGNCDDEYYKEGIYVGYRFFEKAGKKPLYPFGYGKSYTAFSYHCEEFLVNKNELSVKIYVKNEGEKYAGKEVIQLYVSAPSKELEKPLKELKAFAKTRILEPGESQILEIKVKLEDCASYYEEKAAWMLEEGKYTVLIGNSSESTKVAGIFDVKESIVTTQAKNLFGKDCDMQECSLPDSPKNENPNAPIAVVKKDDIPVRLVKYQAERKCFETDCKEQVTFYDIKAGKATLEELVAQLSVEEMANIAVGTLRPADDESVIGNASVKVPGAAGDTSPLLEKDRNVMSLIMADGPAGLRLQPHFRVNKKDGNLLPGGEIIGDVSVPFDSNFDAEETIDYYQYCTAIPIGWGLAQSWNEELIEELGNMVGREMEEYHVQLWLAPAMNIHRNPLCGRNFEYYSEDPVLSGKISAAMTRGVQKHKGCGTCIKHFALNNQEENRYFVNEHVGERALREIYLKPFEIAVKESQPMTVMTSYNLINGIHAANRYDLLQSVLRDEWGFDGFVMTDWFSSQDISMLKVKYNPKYPISASTGCIYAGNDVQMPGCHKNVIDIIEAVNSGTVYDGYKITKADLQQAAYNVLKIVYRCWV